MGGGQCAGDGLPGPGHQLCPSNTQTQKAGTKLFFCFGCACSRAAVGLGVLGALVLAPRALSCSCWPWVAGPSGPGVLGFACACSGRPWVPGPSCPGVLGVLGCALAVHRHPFGLGGRLGHTSKVWGCHPKCDALTYPKSFPYLRLGGGHWPPAHGRGLIECGLKLSDKLIILQGCKLEPSFKLGTRLEARHTKAEMDLTSSKSTDTTSVAPIPSERR